MIGLVEQLLTGKPASLPQPTGTDGQQSPNETVEKEASFLTLLMQLFGGIVQPSVKNSETVLTSSDQGEEAMPHLEGVPPADAPVMTQASAQGSAKSADLSPRMLLSSPLPPPAGNAEVMTDLLPSPLAMHQNGEQQAVETATILTDSRDNREPTPTDPHHRNLPVDQTRHGNGDTVPSVSPNSEGEVENISNNRERMREKPQSEVVLQSKQIVKDSPVAVPTPISFGDEAALAAEQAGVHIAANRKEEERGIPSNEMVRVRDERLPASVSRPVQVVEGTAEIQSKQTRVRASAEANSSAHPSRPDANGPLGEAAEAVGESHRVDAQAHTTLPANWEKMKLTVRDVLPAHQFTPAETAVALKAVADSFSVGRIFISQSERQASVRTELKPSPDEGSEPDAAKSGGDMPDDVAVKMNRKPDGAHENVPSADADNIIDEGVPNWSLHRAARKEQIDQPLETASSNHPIEGTEKSLVMHVHQSEMSAKAESSYVKGVPAKTAGVPIELPEGFARDFVVKIADELRLHVAGRTSEVRVRLKPEHLGEVSLKVTMQEGELAARLDVSVPAVKAALDAQLPQLREALASQGIEIRRFDVVADEQRNAQREQQRFQHQPQSGRQTDVDATETYAAMRDLGYNTVEYII